MRMNVAVLALIGCFSAATHADVVRLRNGGELRGVVVSSENATLTLRSFAGSSIALSLDSVHFVTRRTEVEELYETRLEEIADTADAHWELADWCRANKLKDARRWQARETILRDPNHVEARRLLGYIRDDAEWTTRERGHWQRGYVKSGRRYVPRQTRDTIAKTSHEKELQSTWLSRMNRLANAIDSGDESALAELAGTRDPMALAGLTAYFRESESIAARKAYVTALGRTKHEAMIAPLVEQAVFDVSAAVRTLAAKSIPANQREAAVRLLSDYLRSNSNQVVQQAADALGESGHKDAVEPLIEALVTLHEYSTRSSGAKEVQERAIDLLNKPNLSSREVLIVLQTGIVPKPGVESTTDESNGQIQALYPHQNLAALNALKRLTGEDFGFDQRTWRLWLRSQRSR